MVTGTQSSSREKPIGYTSSTLGFQRDWTRRFHFLVSCEANLCFVVSMIQLGAIPLWDFGFVFMRPCVVLCSPSKTYSSPYWGMYVGQFWITYNQHACVALLWFCQNTRRRRVSCPKRPCGKNKEFDRSAVLYFCFFLYFKPVRGTPRNTTDNFLSNWIPSLMEFKLSWK